MRWEYPAQATVAGWRSVGWGRTRGIIPQLYIGCIDITVIQQQRDILNYLSSVDVFVYPYT